MVEMLGVLAVIGVLSVAGIAGYSIAMRNYRANEIVNAASMFYVLAKAQNQGNGPSGDIDYATVGGTNPSGATLTYTNNAFTITFTDTDDCSMAANKLGDKATADCANKTITVNFGGEITSNSIDLNDVSGPDLDGQPCTGYQDGFYCLGKGSNSHNPTQIDIVDCNHEYGWSFIGMNCIGTCRDNNPHENPEDTCDGVFQV